MNTATPTKPIVLGPTIDKMFDLREKKRQLESEISKIESEYAGLEEQLMEKLNKEGTDKAAGKRASVSITSSTVANVTDWAVFDAFARKNNYMHLYQRRVSEPAFREILEKKGVIPGATPFTKKKLNLRVI